MIDYLVILLIVLEIIIFLKKFNNIISENIKANRIKWTVKSLALKRLKTDIRVPE